MEIGLSLSLTSNKGVGGTPPAENAILLETGDDLLLESGDAILLES